jgi:23S rRNA (uridine2552-2'-O)-methyltransferase
MKPGKKGKKNKWDDDSYTRLAKQKGYPARSVFKLEEIQKKYRLIKNSDSVLDIGASPGSWSLFVSRILGPRGKLVGVDLKPRVPSLNLSCPNKFILGNIMDQEPLDAIIREGPYTLLLSDAAPSTTGDHIVDSARSCELTRRILFIAGSCLKERGRLVMKIFQGEDSAHILADMKKVFSSVKAYKPSASRKKSTEIYYIGFDYAKD